MADTKISALPAASALDGTEIYAVDQGGTSVGVTGAQIVTLVTDTNVLIAGTAAKTMGFYGVTPLAQRATTSTQQTSRLSTTASASSNFSARINTIVPALQEVMNTLYAYGLWGAH